MCRSPRPAEWRAGTTRRTGPTRGERPRRIRQSPWGTPLRSHSYAPDQASDARSMASAGSAPCPSSRNPARCLGRTPHAYATILEQAADASHGRTSSLPAGNPHDRLARPYSGSPTYAVAAESHRRARSGPIVRPTHVASRRFRHRARKVSGASLCTPDQVCAMSQGKLPPLVTGRRRGETDRVLSVGSGTRCVRCPLGLPKQFLAWPVTRRCCRHLVAGRGYRDGRPIVVAMRSRFPSGKLLIWGFLRFHPAEPPSKHRSRHRAAALQAMPKVSPCCGIASTSGSRGDAFRDAVRDAASLPSGRVHVRNRPTAPETDRIHPCEPGEGLREWWISRSPIPPRDGYIEAGAILDSRMFCFAPASG